MLFDWLNIKFLVCDVLFGEFVEFFVMRNNILLCDEVWKVSWVLNFVFKLKLFMNKWEIVFIFIILIKEWCLYVVWIY